MRFIKKHAWIFLGLSILSLYFFTRLYNIFGLPIFTDEAIYARWAQIAANDANWRFISLTDGKQPMFVWIGMILMKVIEDPLLASRMVSIIAGFFSTIGIFLVANELFKNKKIGLFASLMYVLYPFALVYDRMALYDSLVAMFIIWCLYLEILLVRYVRLDIALILGMVAGAGMLTKTNANFALILLPFLLLLFNFKDKQWKKSLTNLALFSLVAVIIANGMYAILRLSPFFHIIADKNFVFIYQPQEWLQNPFAYFILNLSPLFDWLVRYATLPFLVLVIGAFLVEKKYLREKLLLLVWFVVPFVALAFFGRLLYPRFILFMTMPLLILSAYSLYHLLVFAKKRWLQYLTVVVFLIMFVVNDYFIITDFAKAAIPRSDKSQFLTGWPSGVGVNETITFLKEKAKNEKIYVGTEGTFGLMPYALELYLHQDQNITIKGFWPVNENIPQELIDASKTMPTYVVFYQECPSCPARGVAPEQWKAHQILQIKKIEGEYYTLYQIKP